MKFEIVELQERDVVLATINVGAMDNKALDKYCKKYVNELKGIFETQVAVFPHRAEGDSNSHFVIVRKNFKNKSKKQL